MSIATTDYKTVFNNTLNNLKAKGAFGLSLVEKAFTFAQQKHEGQTRKSGQPYISHPVEVMAILERLDFSSEVLAAALLHDVVEDCNVSVKQLEENFGPTVAKIVDAVTEIKPNEQLVDIDSEIKTYQKLVSMGKINYFAFYIKFADRLHNLKTLGVFKKYKQVEKIKQTERFLVPLLKILKAKELYTEITNQIFLHLTEKEELDHFLKLYNFNLNANKTTNQNMAVKLNIIINKLLTKNKIDNSLKQLLILPLTQFEIKQEIEKIHDFKNLKNLTHSHFALAPAFKLVLIFSKTGYEKIVFKLLEETDFLNIMRLKSYEIDQFNQQDYFVFQNTARTKFKTFLFNQTSYTTYRNGSTEGSVIDIVDEDFEHEIIGDYITVKTRSGEVLLMPEGSTVLDFAFKIHNDFGFSCKYAHLNDSPHKTPIYTKLSNGDKINLIIEEDENKNAKNIATLKWLTYVNNPKSKKQLLKYFENLYE